MDNETFSMSDTQKPLYNPFETDQVTTRSDQLKDDGWPSLPPFGDGEFTIRESLGVLPNTMLIQDSLTSDLLPTNFEDFQMGSPRESLGILNISSMDLGRESIGIFDINKPFFKREFSDSDNRAEQLQQENLIPRILCHGVDDKADSASFADLNRAFLFPHSRKISGVSSGSSANPSFYSGGFEEFSKISSISAIQKMDLEPSPISFMGIVDPFNEAFQIRHGINSYKSSSTHYSFASRDLEIMRRRIQSLPLALEENCPLYGVAFGNKTENVSFDDGLICRGVEDDKDLDDSVFLQDKRKRNKEDATFNWGEKSFDGEHYLLDCTPQPDWGEWESSKSNIEDKDKSPVYNREDISKQVDKMLGMQPVNLEERLKLKNVSKCNSASSINTSQNISKISRASQCSIPENLSCTSNNFSQDLSKISRNSEENISKLIKNLSDIINEKENLSKSQRNESHHMLNCLASILRDSTNKGTNSEDSGHSSVEDPHLDDKNEKIDGNNGKNCEALDLSCKRNHREANKSTRSQLKSPSVRNPPQYNNGIVTDNNTKSNNASQSSNHSNASAKSIISFRRHSNISLGPEKFKRAKSGIVPKKEPLRAVLPVENMAKDTKGIGKSAQLAITPERNDGGHRMALKSKKTSTPLQEPKLKPVAASTPASRQSKDNALSPAARPKFARSFSHQPRLSSSTEHPSSGRKSGENAAPKVAARKPISKGDGVKFARRNSITESTLNREKNSEDLGPQKLKRSFSTGRESKIFMALSKVRQNILNSPYYRRSTDGNDGEPKRFSSDAKPSNKVSQSRKVGKENLKP